MTDKRFEKGKNLFENNNVILDFVGKDRLHFWVESKDQKYQVIYDKKTNQCKCLCPDKTYNNPGKCKHMIAVEKYIYTIFHDKKLP